MVVSKVVMSGRAFGRAAVIAAFGVLTAVATAQSAPQVVPVGINSGLMGSGASPLAAAACAGSILVSNGSNYGDNCPAGTGGGSQLNSPQGVAVDKYGNVYVADYSDRLVRVTYYGGASVAALITAASSGFAISATRNAPAPVPVVGDVYTIAGYGGTTLTALAATNGTGQYYCANYAGSGSQPVALNNLGDGCPAAAGIVGARDVAVDTDGNLFLTDYTDSRVRVLCANCAVGTKAATLIALENPGVVPVNGAMYTIFGFSVGYRDGPGYANATSATSTVALLRTPTQSVLSSADDVFVADNIDNAVRLLYNGGAVATAMLAGEGVTAPVVGNTYTLVGAGCVQAPATTNGSSTSYECLTVVPGTGFTVDSSSAGEVTATGLVWSLYLDANSNLYYTSYPGSAANTRVKVLYGGIAPPLTFPNATYPTLKTGYTYSFAGQGTGTAGQQDGVAPSALALTYAESVGGDANGNIFFFDYSNALLYETYAQNGITAIIAGGGTETAGASDFCNGSGTGPTMTDAFYDGCPATQVKFTSPRGPVVADANGNLYFGDSVGYFVRKFSYNPTFPAGAVGSTSVAQPYAFTFLSAQTLLAPSFRVASDFVDAGNDSCAPGLVAVAGFPGTTCVVNVKYTPSLPGLRAGAVDLLSATATLGGTLMTSIATGSGLAIDPGTASTTGTSYKPNGIAVDNGGRVYFSDLTTKSVIRYSGGTASVVATGFTVPTGVAADAIGNVYVADSSKNTITEVPAAGTAFTLTSAVSSPHGLTTDGTGRLYVADTGNNRVLAFAAGSLTPTVLGFTGLSAVQAVAVDYVGNVYALDSTRVAKLTPAGVQTTAASVSGGTGLVVDAGDNLLVTTGQTLEEFPVTGSAVAISSSLVTPEGLAVDGAGNAYIADNGFVGYYELQRTAGFYKFITNPATEPIELTSVGTTAVSTTAYTQSDTVDYTLVASTTNGCSGALASGTECGLTATFAPKNSGIVTDNVVFTAPVNNGSPTLTLTTVSLVPAIAVQAQPVSLTYGNTEILTATIYGPNNTGGTVNFYSNGSTTALATVTSNASAMATYSFVPAVGGYSITATYTPVGATTPTVTTTSATPFTVTPATPLVSLVVSPAAGYTTTSVALKATVAAPATSPLGGVPTGSVTFVIGSTTLGSAPLVAGVASLSVTNLPVGTDCILAEYMDANSNFSNVTSSCGTAVIAPGFGVLAGTTALAFQKNYQEAQALLTVNPGGTTYTLAFACAGLPAKISCTFTPSTLALTGLTTPQTVQMLVSNSQATGSVRGAPQLGASRGIALALLPLGAMLLIGLRRRRLGMLVVIAVLSLGALASLNGCGSGPTADEQASGTYPFTVTATSGSTTVATIPFTLTIP